MNQAQPNSADPMPDALVRSRYALVAATHGVLFALALLTAFCLAYNFRLETRDQFWFATLYLPMLAIALPVKLAVFWWTGQYRGSWRYVGLRDLIGVISASLIGTFVFLLFYFILENIWKARYGIALIDNHALPVLRQSSTFSLDLACTIGFVAAAKIVFRFYYEDIQADYGADVRKVLIVGAGDAAEAVLREMFRAQRDRYECVGLLDDAAPVHSRIHGVEVLGGLGDIRRFCEELDVGEVLIAMRRMTPKVIRGLVEQCEGTGVHFRTIPAVADLIDGRVQVSQFRHVDIDDLLRRERVELDTTQIGAQIRGKRVLVTGAGGSIGSEICRQVAAFVPASLVLIERSENALFEIHRELRRRFDALDVVPCVADIADAERIQHLFESHRPTIIFHAAAHKHVPMMENNVGEAIKNNIGGTATIARAANACRATTMVMVSTDKAVNPTSVMGCSKRVAEMYVQSLTEKGRTSFITVRFGNVLGSSGSVVPIFKQQIADGGPVTVTHPDMVRFFMTIPEAAQLVLQAGTMGAGGEIYVLHMGDPVRIVDLARDMITLSGLRPGIDIEIEFSGVRPGEKLYEELSGEGEDIGNTAHPKIGIWKHRPEPWEAVHTGIEQLLAMADAASPAEVRAALHALVPEYTTENAHSPAKPTADTPSLQ